MATRAGRFPAGSSCNLSRVVQAQTLRDTETGKRGDTDDRHRAGTEEEIELLGLATRRRTAYGACASPVHLLPAPPPPPPPPPRPASVPPPFARLPRMGAPPRARHPLGAALPLVQASRALRRILPLERLLPTAHAQLSPFVASVEALLDKVERGDGRLAREGLALGRGDAECVLVTGRAALGSGQHGPVKGSSEAKGQCNRHAPKTKSWLGDGSCMASSETWNICCGSSGGASAANDARELGGRS